MLIVLLKLIVREVLGCGVICYRVGVTVGRHQERLEQGAAEMAVWTIATRSGLKHS